MDLSKVAVDFINTVGQKEAAEFFGVSQPIVSCWVKGTKPVTLRAVQKLFSGKPNLFSAPSEVTASAAPVDLVTNPTKVEELAKMPWEGKELIILSTTNRDYNHGTVTSLMNIFDKEKMFYRGLYSNFLPRARNQLAHFFLESKAEWAFWIDDDIILPCGDAAWFKKTTKNPYMNDVFAGLNTIKRLMWHNKKLISGCYFGRNEEGKAVFHAAMANRSINAECHTGPRNETLETVWIPAGCLLTHRSVFTDIIKEFPDIRLSDEHAQALGYRYGFFDPISSGIGEDVSFCDRAKKAGHQAHIDLALMPAHMGPCPYNYHNTKTR